jgi:hypothetical protein
VDGGLNGVTDGGFFLTGSRATFIVSSSGLKVTLLARGFIPKPLIMQYYI